MQLHNIKRKFKNKRSLAVGRGGKRGKTSGKGTKGQNVRAGRKKRPELRDRIKQFPKLRGRGKNSNKTIQDDFRPVNLVRLENVFNDGAIVSPKTLVEKGAISLKSGKYPKVKILSMGELTKRLIFSSCKVSAGARDKIIKVGGVIR